MDDNLLDISVIIPVYNEEGNVASLHREIFEACNGLGKSFEIIFIDDGSKDGTGRELKSLKPLKYIRLRKNFGQTAAIDAGIKHSKGKYIITMDGDGQNDPKDIPKLYDYLIENDLDIVSGWRNKRKDSFLKCFISRGAHYLRSFFIKDGIHDSGCSLKIYRRECFDSLDLYGEMHRFIPALLRIKGFTLGEVKVAHRPRTKGKTKYNWKRTIKGFIDIISIWFWKKYAVRPLHIFGASGLFLMTIGFIFGLYNIYLKFFLNANLSKTVWPTLTVFFFLTGIQLFVTGILADILSKSYYHMTKDKTYSIKEVSEQT